MGSRFPVPNAIGPRRRAGLSPRKMVIEEVVEEEEEEEEEEREKDTLFGGSRSPTSIQKVKSWMSKIDLAAQEDCDKGPPDCNECKKNGAFMEVDLDTYGEPNWKPLKTDNTGKGVGSSLRTGSRSKSTPIPSGKAPPRRTPTSKSKSLFSSPRPKRLRGDKIKGAMPPSPESEKKKELCRYLQLMKPTDRKAIALLQNRRSTRVKNINIMQRKRALETTLKKDTTKPTFVWPNTSSYRCYVLGEEEDWFKMPLPGPELRRGLVTDFEEGTDFDWFKQMKAARCNISNGAKDNGKEALKSSPRRCKSIRTRSDSEASLETFTFPKPDKVLLDIVHDFDDAIKEECEFHMKGIEEKRGAAENGTGMAISKSRKSKRKERRRLKKEKSSKRARIKIKLWPKKRNNTSHVVNKTNQEVVNSQDNSSTTAESPTKSTEAKPECSNQIPVQDKQITNNNNINNSCGGKEDVLFNDYTPGKTQNGPFSNQSKENCYYSEIIDVELPESNETRVSQSEKESISNEKFESTQSPNRFSSSSINGQKALHFLKSTPSSSGTGFKIGLGNNLTSPRSSRLRRNSYSVVVSPENGEVLKIFYVDSALVVCQESLVSFWTQTALGNVLGVQNTWLKKGDVQRFSLHNPNFIPKDAMDMVITNSDNTTIAYIELWTKEHESDKREQPVADVFAVIYFWKNGQTMDKKVLQLENIHGFADDVQYSVLKSSSNILVSWQIPGNETKTDRTCINCYQLAEDFQSVISTDSFETVQHYVSSLHYIEGRDRQDLVMGCGENYVSFWNIDNGCVEATICMSEIKSPLSTLWVKREEPFIFSLQQCVNKELRLIAINHTDYDWLRLVSYEPPSNYDMIKGVSLEHGKVVALYEQGMICWNAQTAAVEIETSEKETQFFMSGKYVISIVNHKVIVQHVLSHLLTADS